MGFLKFSVQLAHASDNIVTLEKEKVVAGAPMNIVLPP